ncbi:hypothetical protein ARMSODRAFT_1026969 [Armillaria solidipes]|uniref:GINS subunit domain-containing protein n=1 Tax=Armillaria solidipes TaxID=1076256 RepID=A0A2H3AM60_9AGAR|nr:hypothetical protein ARMSODRAFT_1026969 [Armillaria solidipes]
MDWDDEYTLLVTSSKGDALDFLNLDAPAPTEAETPLSELIRTAPWLVARPHMAAALRGDPSTSEEEHIRIMLVQTEVERVFIVRSYIRTRLYKIEKSARFITADAEIQTWLTTAEKAYASSTTYGSASPLLGAVESATNSGSPRRPVHFCPTHDPTNLVPSSPMHSESDHLSVCQTGQPSLWRKISLCSSHSMS